MSAPPPEPPKKDEKAAAPPTPKKDEKAAPPPAAPPSTPASAPPPPADPTPPATAKAPSEISSKKKKGKAAAAPASGSLPPSTSPSNASIGLRQVEVQSFADVRPALQKWLEGQDKLFGAAEKSSGVEREKIFYGLCGVLALWLIAGPGGGFICNLIGVAYPVYASILALRSGGKEDDTQWLVYWTTYGTLSMVDFFADRISAYFPLYWLLKAIFFLYLELPQTLGAHNVYVKYLDPMFDKLAKRASAL
jgi:receptor expression-enhancing protein 5/6